MGSPREHPRSRRVGERIQVEIAEILSTQARDPRFQALTVTGATVSRDLSSAQVWVVGRFAKDEEESVLQALAHATPYLRTLLAPRLQLRTVPQLHFRFDPSIETGARIEQLLRELDEPRED
jgi:ribosome-binding factor A